MANDHRSLDHRDLRERIAMRFFRMVNPVTRRMIPAGTPTGAPNVLLLIPGRRSGIERTTPVTVLDFEEHTYVQATYGASGWGRNLRAAEEVTMVHSGGAPSRDSARRSSGDPPARARALPPLASAPTIARPARPAARRAPAPIPHAHRRHARGIPRRSSAPPAV